MSFTDSGHLALAWVPAVTSILVVTARTYVRLKTRVIGTDDYLMMLALLWFICYAALTTALYDAVADTDLEVAQQTTVQTMATIVAYLSLNFGRTSVGWLLLRLLTPPMVWQRWVISVTIAGLQIATFLAIMADFFPYCSEDIIALPDITGCLTPTVFLAFSETWNFYGCFVDVAFSTIPLSMIYGLKLRPGRKVALITVLCLGWVAGIFTLLRAITAYVSWSPTTISNVVLVATSLEQALVIICGSLATLLPLWHYWTKGTEIRPPNYVSSPNYSHEPKSLSTAKSSTSVSSQGQHLISTSIEPSGIHINKDFGISTTPHTSAA